jgi:hypothetical protein
VRSETRQVDDGLIAVRNLLRSGTRAVWDVVGHLTRDERIDLAASCWRRAHFHEVGLAIAALCEKDAMVHRLGAVVGSTLFEQSRQLPTNDPRPVSAARRITLPALTPSSHFS